MGFFSNQASYGRPAEAPYVDQPLELEAQANAAANKAKLSYLSGINLPDVQYTDVDQQRYNNLLGQMNQQVGDLHDEVSKNGGELTPELKQKAQQLRSYIHNNQEATSIQQRHDREKEYVDSINKLPDTKYSSDRKNQLLYLAKRSLSENPNVDFYLPNPTESTGYTEKAIAIANAMSVTDDPKKQYAYIQETIGKQALPEDQFALIQSKLSKEKTPERIAAVIKAWAQNDPLVANDIKSDSDFEALKTTDYLTAISDPNSPYYNPYQAVSFNSDIIRQQHFDNKINQIAGIAAEAQKTQTYDQSVGTHQISKWAMGTKLDSSGQQFTLPATNTFGQVDDKNILDNYKEDGTIKSRKVIGTTQKVNTPSGQLATYSNEPLKEDIVRLQRKYPEIAAISKTPKELIVNIKNALHSSEDYNYNFTIPEKIIVSKYLDKASNSLNPAIIDENGKPTDKILEESDYKNLKNASYKLNPITGKLTSTIGEKTYSLDIPDQFRNLIQPSMDLYSVAQKAWTTGKPQNIQDNSGKTITVSRDFNSSTKKYELKYYHPSLKDSKVNFEDMLNLQAESDQNAIYEKLKSKDLFYETPEESTTTE